MGAWRSSLARNCLGRISVVEWGGRFSFVSTLDTCTKNICNVYKNICIHVGVGTSADPSLPASQG